MSDLDSCRFGFGHAPAPGGIYFFRQSFKKSVHPVRKQQEQYFTVKITGIVTSLFFLEAAVPLYLTGMYIKGENNE
ncbi:hypothetical protein [Paenibacillus sp. BAC0078]